jgi:wyosine [tRNA(Phe)-imidazoG37] synthetase (radical SAM superfamily)
MRDYTYGPFQSRRLGLSLGINVLLSYKICTFNCAYCEIGSTDQKNLVSPNFRIKLPPTAKFRKELFSILTLFPHLKSITFGYNGEPTLNEFLLDFLKIAIEVREKLRWTKQKPLLTLFTNSSTLYFDEIRERVKQFEFILAKLDVATDEDFKRTNRPHINSPNIETIIDSLVKLREEKPKQHKLVLQSLFYNSYKEEFISNNSNSNVDKLALAIKKIKPDLVQIYTTARIPAEYYVYSIDDSRKREIVKNIESLVQDKNVKINFY